MPRKPSELTVTDQFCGAGGSSVGAELAGFTLRMAMNHWPLAIETHNSNFPNADHACVDISSTNPERYPATNILITSPECKAHTYARGKGRQKAPGLPGVFDFEEIAATTRSRATMWDVPRFAEQHNYELIIVENVVEARDWLMYDAWLMAMKALGYLFKPVFYNSMFAGAPQSRDRVYMVFWKKGNPTPQLDFRPPAFCATCDAQIGAVQSWKNPSRPYGRYRTQYTYRCPRCAGQVEPFRMPAAGAIDWALASKRIGDRSKPLEPKTMARIEKGIERFFRNAQLEPLILESCYSNDPNRLARPVTEPLPTQTGRQSMALLEAPFVATMRNHVASRAVTEPLTTVTSEGNHHMLVSPPGAIVSNFSPGWVRSVTDVLGSITTRDHHALLQPPQAFLAAYYGTDNVRHVAQPMGTVTTRDRQGLVQAPLEGTPRVEAEDCAYRMLEPHEIQRAMAFPDTYAVKGTKRDRVRQLGNAVTPPVMSMLLQRCAESLA